MSRRITLWHPDSPGMTVEADVRWPRYLWVKGPDRATGQPRSTATLRETIRAAERREQERVAKADAEVRAIIATAPDKDQPLAEHARYVMALSEAMEKHYVAESSYPWRNRTLSIPNFVYEAYMRGVRAVTHARDVRERENRRLP